MENNNDFVKTYRHFATILANIQYKIRKHWSFHSSAGIKTFASFKDPFGEGS